jgi:hypothetical protein
MSISKKSPAQLKELQDTLVSCPHIAEVHFTKDGNHFLNKYELHDITKNGPKPSGKFYGHLKHDLVVSKIVGERKFYKHASVAEPKTEIVETLSRDEILNYDQKPKGQFGKAPKAE